MAVAPSTIRVQPDSTGKFVDNVEVDTGLVGVGVVQRQVINVADPEFPEARTKVTAATPAAGDYGLTVKAEALGAQADAEAAGNGSVVALLKRLRTLLSGSLAVSGPVTDVQLRAAAVPVAGPLTDTQLRAAVVPVSGTFFQATQPVSAVQLPAALRAGRLDAADTYTGGEVLPDQSGVNSVLTFTFSAPVHLIWVLSQGADLVARVDPFGGVPAANAGIPAFDQAPVAIVILASTLQVYAPTGTAISVWAFRYS